MLGLGFLASWAGRAPIEARVHRVRVRHVGLWPDLRRSVSYVAGFFLADSLAPSCCVADVEKKHSRAAAEGDGHRQVTLLSYIAAEGTRQSYPTTGISSRAARPCFISTATTQQVDAREAGRKRPRCMQLTSHNTPKSGRILTAQVYQLYTVVQTLRDVIRLK